MSEPQKVYIVSSGSYSAYGIRGVFLDAAAAEAFVRKHNAGRPFDQAEIEEWTDATPTGRDVDYYWHLSAMGPGWEVRWNYQGMVTQRTREKAAAIDVRESSMPLYNIVGDRLPDRQFVHVDAEDLERGKKAMYDKIAEIKAREAGLT